MLAEVAATEIMPRFRQPERLETREKGPGDPVTAADLASEAALTTALPALLPGARVVGEEGVAQDPEQMALLDQPGPVWVVDPVDGTRAFARGEPGFGVMVALVQDGETLAGWIHDPVAGWQAHAIAGRGAWRDGQRLQVAPGGALDTLEMFVGSTTGHQKTLRGAVGTVRACTSAAHIYMGLAEGRLHAAVFNRCQPWDHCAGLLLHAEAGGVGQRLDGTPYRATATARQGAPLLAAPDQATWQALVTVMAPV